MTGRVVLVDQATRHASVSGMIAADIAEHRLQITESPDCSGDPLPTRPFRYSEPLEAHVIPDEARIARRAYARS